MWLAAAKQRVPMSEGAEKRAGALVAAGFTPIDAVKPDELALLTEGEAP
jgi:hypothetical protein